MPGSAVVAAEAFRRPLGSVLHHEDV